MDDNNIDLILDKLKRFTGTNFYYQELLEEIKNALFFTKETYIKKFNIYQDFTNHDLLLLLERIVGKDEVIIDNAPLFNIIYHKKENKTIILLPDYIVTVNQDISTVKRFSYNLRDKILKNVEKIFGNVAAGYFNFTNGEVFLTSYKNSKPGEIIKNVNNIPWNEIQLHRLGIDGFIKTDGTDSVIIIPSEEGSKYRLLELVKRFNIIFNNDIESPLAQKFNRVMNPYKEVIKIIEKYNSYINKNVTVFNTSILNPFSISYHLMKLVAKERGNDVGLMYSTDYGKVIEITDSNNKIFITLLPLRAIITKGDPELNPIFNALLGQLKNDYGISDCLFLVSDGLVCKKTKQDIQNSISVDMFWRKIDLNIIKRNDNDDIILSSYSVNNFIEKVIFDSFQHHLNNS